jgi:hypothetical protein
MMKKFKAGERVHFYTHAGESRLGKIIASRSAEYEIRDDYGYVHRVKKSDIEKM